MLGMGEVPHLTNFSQARLQSEQVAEAHAHTDMHEVFFVESGESSIEVDGVAYSLTPGVCVAAAPHETHEVSNLGEVEMVLTYFGLEA